MSYCHDLPWGPCAPCPSCELLALLWQAHWHLLRLLCSVPGRSTGASDPSHFFLILLISPLLLGFPLVCLRLWLLRLSVWSPLGRDPRSSPGPLPPQGLLCAFFAALIPFPCTGSVPALSWKKFRTQVALPGLAAWLAQQVWE